MTDKEKRHKVEERGEFTESQKHAIAQKSDDCCVWCGKKVYFGYGATVDHFIPLKKGGTNDFDNLVMMCHNCNQKKGSKIVPVHVAAYHLKNEHKDKLDAYFNNYVHTYDYISRGNLMACDIYEVFFMPEALADADARARKRGKRVKIDFKQSKYLMYRAYPGDEDRLTEYYIKYLKKYNILDSPEAARENIRFWMRFGSIYFIEKNSDITVMAAVTVNQHGYLSFTIFAYYSTLLSATMARGIVTVLGDAIMEENNLSYIPICTNMVKADSLTYRIIEASKAKMSNDVFLCQTWFSYNYDLPLPDDEESKEFKECINNFLKFMDHFYDIENKIHLYLYENDLMDYSWMADEILGRDYFDEKYYRPIDLKDFKNNT